MRAISTFLSKSGESRAVDKPFIHTGPYRLPPPKNGAGERLFGLLVQELVEVGDQLIDIHAMDHAGLLDALGGGVGQPRQCMPYCMKIGAVLRSTRSTSPMDICLVIIGIPPMG
jgi:hypothetical protein